MAEGFPEIPRELLKLRCPPSDVALSFNSIWAYGCHFRCNPKQGLAYVTFDCRITFTSEDSTTLDVGILKKILLVTYGNLKCIVMKVDWIKPRDKGRAVVKKD